VGGNTLTIAGNSVTSSSGGIDASNASATVAFTQHQWTFAARLDF